MVAMDASSYFLEQSFYNLLFIDFSFIALFVIFGSHLTISFNRKCLKSLNMLCLVSDALTCISEIRPDIFSNQQQFH